MYRQTTLALTTRCRMLLGLSDLRRISAESVDVVPPLTNIASGREYLNRRVARRDVNPHKFDGVNEPVAAVVLDFDRDLRRVVNVVD